MNLNKPSTFFLVLIFFFSSCGLGEDTYTIQIDNPYNFDIEVGSNSFVGEVIDAYGSKTITGDVVSEASLIATEVGDNTILGSTGSTGMVVFNPEPDQQYRWTAGTHTVRSESDQGVDCDEDGYAGPEFDFQIDSQCRAAYIYDCFGDIAGKNAACDIYYDYGQDVWVGSDPFPDCPYCD